MNKHKSITLPDGDTIIVFDELIPKTLQESLMLTVDGTQSFPWYLLRKVGHTYASDLNYKDPNVIDGGGFYHSAVDDGKVVSKYYDYFKQLLFFFTDKTGIEVDNIIRIRLRYTNQQTGHTENTYGPVHVDFTKYNVPYYTLLYYLEDSDGDTILFDKIFNPAEETYDPENISDLKIVYRQTPKQGTGLLFNGHRYHSGNYPIDYQTRIVINFDFTIK
jgi:hypothetical protein